MRQAQLTVRRVLQGGLVASALLSLAACSQPQAVTDTPDANLLLTHSIAGVQPVSARSFMIREVRLGHGLDMAGKVPTAFSASRFLAGDPIRMSMWVAATPPGSVIRASILDETDRRVWSDEEPAPENGSYLAFDLGRQLPTGVYRVQIDVDHAAASRAGFEVLGRESWARR